jgi:hypothetical protein
MSAGMTYSSIGKMLGRISLLFAIVVCAVSKPLIYATLQQGFTEKIRQ